MRTIWEASLSYVADAVTLGVVLIVGITGYITVPFLFVVIAQEYASPRFLAALNADGLKYFSSFVVSCGVLVAVLTFKREKSRQGRELEERRSRFFFEQAKTGLEEVYDLLKDQNNDRITWIRAARVLLHSVNLGKQISVSEYKEAYRLIEEQIRHKLIMALSVYDKDTKEWNALPGQFFCGLRDWEAVRSLDEAARIASHKIAVQTVSIDRVVRGAPILPLSADSVVAIYNFLEYPRGYDDPLRNVTVWPDDWDKGHYGIDQGARRFVYHRPRTFAIDGELHRADEPKKNVEQPTG
jgi:hypothetical protein